MPAELICSVLPQTQWLARDAQGLRPNGSLALGVAARCCQLAGRPDLTAQLGLVRDTLDDADVQAMPAARAAAAEFAFLAAGTAIALAGSRGILADQHPQRLAREALFLLVFGSRPPIRENLVSLLVAG